eukprot:CAMPEP_0175899082 /NCGR_PEP_ID=MMETSP0108-20121206/1596_1 /TAXON_ID=195067 ORGANISM="Goniomonas pacifica, Strain CCMP1869" /NCGR_SAMPLE_ID=MMETSP0108 /ASSEMBLY_ACC=CAM_ASM_000204 /LENGTH=36 /DNA_ID= /DNA_START= /DNA_END= /DNA_ORIENTATION=
MTKAVKAMGCKSAASGLSAPSFLLGALAMTAVAMLH